MELNPGKRGSDENPENHSILWVFLLLQCSLRSGRLAPVLKKKRFYTDWVDLIAEAWFKCRSFMKKANVAQLVEQLIRNEQVSGSTPLIGSNI